MSDAKVGQRWLLKQSSGNNRIEEVISIDSHSGTAQVRVVQCFSEFDSCLGKVYFIYTEHYFNPTWWTLLKGQEVPHL